MTCNYDAWLSSFSTNTVVVANIRTATYIAPKAGNKPIVLFVHGINGDHHGMVPVAYLLRDTCRVVFVDMPGHGASELPLGDNALARMQAWAQALSKALHEIGIEITAAVGHSFGAYIVQETGVSTIALLNPPFAATSLSYRSTVVLGHAPPFVARVYQSKTAMIGRGHWLMHKRTKATDEIIAWSSRLTRVTKEQFKFQARLSDQVAPLELVDIERLKALPHLHIVMSEYDRIVDNSFAPLDKLPNATIVTLPTDHVSVFEMPDKVAGEVKKLLSV